MEHRVELIFRERLLLISILSGCLCQIQSLKKSTKKECLEMWWQQIRKIFLIGDERIIQIAPVVINGAAAKMQRP